VACRQTLGTLCQAANDKVLLLYALNLVWGYDTTPTSTWAAPESPHPGAQKGAPGVRHTVGEAPSHSLLPRVFLSFSPPTIGPRLTLNLQHLEGLFSFVREVPSIHLGPQK